MRVSKEEEERENPRALGMGTSRKAWALSFIF
jgi:hypothetical protein